MRTQTHSQAAHTKHCRPHAYLGHDETSGFQVSVTLTCVLGFIKIRFSVSWPVLQKQHVHIFKRKTPKDDKAHYASEHEYHVID